MVIITFVFHLFSPNDLEVVQILLSRKKSQQWLDGDEWNHN